MALSSVLLNNKKAIVLAIVAFLLVIVIFSKLSPSGKTEHKQEFQDRFDWRTMPGVVTSIKNQGKNCKASWAFAAVGALEGHMRFSNMNLTDLSPQSIIDCSKEDHGCEGGRVISALGAMEKLGGITSEAKYPYKGVAGPCNMESQDVVFKFGGFWQPRVGDEDLLKSILTMRGPIAVQVDGSRASFKDYKGGVYNDPDCSENIELLNHAMLLVGYGTDLTDGDYWILKNSWGTEWGEDGYMRLARNQGNMCGIASAPVLPGYRPSSK